SYQQEIMPVTKLQASQEMVKRARTKSSALWMDLMFRSFITRCCWARTAAIFSTKDFHSSISLWVIIPDDFISLAVEKCLADPVTYIHFLCKPYVLGLSEHNGTEVTNRVEIKGRKPVFAVGEA